MTSFSNLGRALILLMLGAVITFGQNVTVADSWYTPATGTMTATWPGFILPNGTTISAGSITTSISAGVFSIKLWPSQSSVTSSGVAGFSYIISVNTPTGTVTDSWVIPTLADGKRVLLRDVHGVVPSGTNANIPVTTSTLKGDGTGSALPVAGTSTNCVYVDGTSGACGTGSTMATQLLDFYVDNVSSTVQRIGNSCSASLICQTNVATFFFVMTAPVTATISAGPANGTVFWYVSSAGVLIAGHNSASTLTCSTGCTVATGITAFPPDSKPLWQTTFTANVWDTITGAMDKRSVYSRTIIAGGSGVASSYDPTTGIQTLSTDPTQVPRYFAGAGAPAINCTTGRDRYTDTTNLHDYFCDATNTWKQADGASGTPPYIRNWTAGNTGGTISLGSGWISNASGVVTSGIGSPQAYPGIPLLTAGTSYVTFMTIIPAAWTNHVNLRSFWTIQLNASGLGTGTNSYDLACKTPGTSDFSTAATYSASQTISFNLTGTNYKIGQLDAPTTWTIPACSAGDVLYVRMSQATRTIGTDPLVLLYFDLQVY